MFTSTDELIQELVNEVGSCKSSGNSFADMGIKWQVWINHDTQVFDFDNNRENVVLHSIYFEERSN